MKNKNWPKATFFLILLLIIIFFSVVNIIMIKDESNKINRINELRCLENGWGKYISDNTNYNCVDSDGQLHILLNKLSGTSKLIWLTIIMTIELVMVVIFFYQIYKALEGE